VRRRVWLAQPLILSNSIARGSDFDEIDDDDYMKLQETTGNFQGTTLEKM